MTGWAIVDGIEGPLEDARISVTDAGFTTGWSVFETMSFVQGRCTNWSRHMQRLEHSCREAMVTLVDARILGREAAACAAALGGSARVRITLTGSGSRVVVATPVDPSRRHRPVRVATAPYAHTPLLAPTVKHSSRAHWRAAVERAGTDDVLLVEKGRLLEGTTCAVLAVIEGELWTPVGDPRVLLSTSVASLLDRAERLGISVCREAPPVSGPWDGLYIASSTRDIAPVVQIDDRTLPGWEPVGRTLADSWSSR